jgi:hypothetical protein
LGSIFEGDMPLLKNDPKIGTNIGAITRILLTVGLFVGLIPFLIICMCPNVVDIDFGRCFLMALLVNSGKVVNQSLSMALQSVLTGNEPIVALRYAISFAIIVGWWCALFGVCCMY